MHSPPARQLSGLCTPPLPNELVGACVAHVEDRQDLFNLLLSCKQVARATEAFNPHLRAARQAKLLKQTYGAFARVADSQSTRGALAKVTTLTLHAADLERAYAPSYAQSFWGPLAASCPRLQTLRYRHEIDELHYRRNATMAHVVASERLTPIIANCGQFRHLRIEGLDTPNVVRAREAHPLWRAVARHKNLLSLELIDVHLSAADLAVVLSPRGPRVRLESLALDCNLFQDNAWACLTGFLAKANRLCAFAVRARPTQAENVALLRMLSTHPRLTHLALHKFGPELGAALEAAAPPPRLQTLSLIDYTMDEPLLFPAAQLQIFVGTAELRLAVALTPEVVGYDEPEYGEPMLRALFATLNTLPPLTHLRLPANFPWGEVASFERYGDGLAVRHAGLRFVQWDFSNRTFCLAPSFSQTLSFCTALKTLKLTHHPGWAAVSRRHITAFVGRYHAISPRTQSASVGEKTALHYTVEVAQDALGAMRPVTLAFSDARDVTTPLDEPAPSIF